MKKILSGIAIAAAFATSGAVFAQKPVEAVLVHPALPEGAQNRVYASSDPAVVMANNYEPRAVASSVTMEPQAVASSVVSPAGAFVEPGLVLVGNVKGPIKGGGPKYDPLGRKIYASRPIGR